MILYSISSYSSSSCLCEVISLLSQHITQGAAHDFSASTPPPRSHHYTKVKLIVHITARFDDQRPMDIFLMDNWCSRRWEIGYHPDMPIVNPLEPPYSFLAQINAINPMVSSLPLLISWPLGWRHVATELLSDSALIQKPSIDLEQVQWRRYCHRYVWPFGLRNRYWSYICFSVSWIYVAPFLLKIGWPNTIIPKFHATLFRDVVSCLRWVAHNSLEGLAQSPKYVQLREVYMAELRYYLTPADLSWFVQTLVNDSQVLHFNPECHYFHRRFRRGSMI